MAFDVAAEAYDRFMGRYAERLAPRFAHFAAVREGQRVLDVGCGPGALTGELVARVGASAVAAVDPSESFVAAARARHPGVDVQVAAAEELPFADATFDVALAQLVVHFMRDAAGGLAEMRRVSRGGGVVAACVWDLAGRRAPMSAFWTAARELDPDVQDESALAGARAGQLSELLTAAGLRDVVETAISVAVEHASFDDWWQPFTLGVGPAGAYVQSLADADRTALRERCRRQWPSGGFTVKASAWAARGVA